MIANAVPADQLLKHLFGFKRMTAVDLAGKELDFGMFHLPGRGIQDPISRRHAPRASRPEFAKNQAFSS